MAGLCCNEVCDLRRVAKKVSQILLQEPISIGHTVMLAYVFYPRFDEKCFDEAPRVGSVLEYSPCIRTVALPLVFNFFDCREEVLSMLRINAIFNSHHHRTCIIFHGFGDYRLWPVH